MARGIPGIWSTLVSIPFFASGGVLAFGGTDYPDFLGTPLILFGAFVLLMGWYIHLVAAPPGPTLRDGEEIIDTRSPTQKAPLVKVCFGLPFLAVAVYLYLFTMQPYVYPTVAFLIGLFYTSTGLLTYWTNSLTTYYITTDRVISEFRLLSLVRHEVPVSKIRAVKESKSPIEAIVGVGNIHVSSGGGTGLGVVMSNIDNSTTFADELRRLT